MSKAGASGQNDGRPGSPSLSFRRGTCVCVCDALGYGMGDEVQ